MNRPDLISTFTKIALWKQTQFEKLVYLDADTVTLRAPDELFKTPATFAAVPDIGWPDCFNSGVLVLTPNMGDYYALLALAQRGISFDGADQGLLNMHFSNWQRLSFTNNCTPSGSYQYVPAYRHFQSTINVVHFIGGDKPWKNGRGTGQGSGVYDELLARWWAVYDKHFRSSISTSPTIWKYVEGEVPEHAYSYPSVEALESKDITTEAPLASPPPPAEKPPAPLPTAKQRRYSIDWDPIHQAPPSQSRPEAAEFPTTTYTMSSSSALFVPPPIYPSALPGGQYQVSSETTATKPPPIFPWEASQVKPTRIFVDDDQQTVTPSIPDDPSSEISDTDFSVETQNLSTTMSPPVVEPFASYQHINAWDENPDIERYLRAQQQRNPHLTKSITAQLTAANAPSSDTLASTTSEVPAPPNTQQPTPRRPSMRLTDFPTELERPSLPVTPAPAPRRPSFWGEERDAAGELPRAEGVPEQTDWDPMKKLEELQRRQSLVLENGPEKLIAGGGTADEERMPEREMVRSSAENLDTSAGTGVGADAINAGGAPSEPSSSSRVPIAPLKRDEAGRPT